MKAETKEEFVKAWEEEFNNVGLLAYSLPIDKVKEFWEAWDNLHKFVKDAADETYK